MSCWVVAALAADFWKIPLQQVLDSIRNGTVRTKVEHGFTFVDVTPQIPDLPSRLPMTEPQESPLTYVEVTHEELEALTEELHISEDEPQTDSPPLGSQAWAEARQKAAERRHAPVRKAA